MKNSRLYILVAMLLSFMSALASFMVDGIYYERLYTGDVSVTYADDAHGGYGYYSGDVVIPDSIRYDDTYLKVAAIGAKAFYLCENLTSAKIPESVSKIGDGAFLSSSLTSVEIPGSIKSIPEDAFRDTRLTSVKIPDSVTSIGNTAFYGCSDLASVEIPWSVTTIGHGAFCRCDAITSIEIPGSVVYMDDGVFSQCNGLTSIVVPESVTYIGGSVFSQCGSLESVEIQSPIRTLYPWMFYMDENLKEVKIPESVTTFGNYAFAYCTGLEYLEIPASVKSINKYALFECSGLGAIYCYSVNPPQCGDYALDGIDKQHSTLYVPAESVERYRAADQWQDFNNIEGIGSGIDDVVSDSDTGTYDVYSLNGVRVLTAADKSAINLLPAGVYVVNGKKYLIR